MKRVQQFHRSIVRVARARATPTLRRVHTRALKVVGAVADRFSNWSTSVTTPPASAIRDAILNGNFCEKDIDSRHAKQSKVRAVV